MDRLLARQLRKLGLAAGSGPADASAWSGFLDLVDRSYGQHQQDRYLLERSLDVSSREMQALYEELRQASESRVALERDRLEAILRGLLDGFCFIRTDGVMEQCNPAAEQMLGLSSRDHDGGVLDRFEIHDGEGERLSSDEILSRIIEGSSIRDENALLLQNGEDHGGDQAQLVHLSLLLYPILLDDGVAGIGLIFRDVSDLKLAEWLRLRLATAVDASADAIFVTDLGGVLEYVNPAFTRITGWPREQALGRRTSILNSGETPPSVYRDLWSTVLAGRVWEGRLKNRRQLPDGNSDGFWAQTTISPFEDENGEPAGFVAVQRDISEAVRRERRQALEHAGAEFRAAAAVILQGQGDLDDRMGRVFDLLSREQRLGMDGSGGCWVAREEGERLTCIAARDLGEPAPDAELIRRGLPEQEPVYDRAHRAYCIPMKHAGGSLGIMLLGGSSPREDDARIPLLSMVGQMMGLALADEHARVEAERAREAALDAAAAKSEFLANMSHEIRTPMNGVLGMLDLIADSELTREQRSFLNTARGSAESLLTIINDILDFSKIEAGKLDLEAIPYDVRTVAEDVAALLSPSAQVKGLELACFIPAEVNTLVIGDPTRLRQVLSNIMGNAVKFTEAGEVVLRVDLQAASDGTGETGMLLRFEVADTGIGISEEAQRKLFQPFVQADGSTTREFGGTGLGLTISRHLVDMMGGELSFESRQGEGTAFRFTLPFLAQAERPDPSMPAQVAGRRVLVVDDMDINRTIVGNYLQAMGVEVGFAPDGNAALSALSAALAAEQPYEAVLLDMQMPGMDGLALARAIRADARIADTGLIMLSSVGHTTKNLTDAGIELGITKPVRQAVLRDALSEVFERRRNRTGQGEEVLPKPDSLSGHVLVVEDNPVNQSVACSMLRKLGISSDVAENGQQAMTMMTDGRYDAVLMDCQMPVMDGFQATRGLREQGRTLPIIAMTANAMAGDREKCLAVGMDDYMAKPMKKSTLRDTLLKWLPKEPAGAPTEISPTTEQVGNSEPVSERDTGDPAANHGSPLRGRVLVVEDNPVNQAVACSMLRRMGVDLEVAGDGVEAVKRAAGGDYDLILMDCEMPIMNGFDATRALREQGARLPVIAMTAHAMTGDRARCLAAGMDDYISKPVNMKALRAVIEKWLATREEPIAVNDAPSSDDGQTAPDTAGEPDIQEPALDQATLEALREAMEDEFDLLVEAFIEDSNQLLDDARGAVANDDAELLARAAHSLKSSGGNFGAGRLADLARSLEELGRTGSTLGAGPILERLGTELDRVQVAVRG
ncbi:MAG: response regulator [Gammaproteobacteria bacterium]